MAESVQLAAQKRDGRGSRAAERLRKQGRIPAVVYGHKEATVSVSVLAEDFLDAYRHGSRVVNLQTDGSGETALIREIQWDPLGKDILHIDFARVAADERVHVDVRIELRGTAPGVNAGGVLDQPMHTLAIECLALNMPESIRVSIAELQIDGAIHVKDLHLPPDVKALDDPDAVVVHVKAPQVEAAAPAAPGETAEPELIGRQKAEEGEAEE
jgi:large subunit ribosomal protein L25